MYISWMKKAFGILLKVKDKFAIEPTHVHYREEILSDEVSFSHGSVAQLTKNQNPKWNYWILWTFF